VLLQPSEHAAHRLPHSTAHESPRIVSQYYKVSLGRKEGVANDYSNLVNVYQTRGDLDKAEEMYTWHEFFCFQLTNIGLGHYPNFISHAVDHSMKPNHQPILLYTIYHQPISG